MSAEHLKQLEAAETETRNHKSFGKNTTTGTDWVYETDHSVGSLLDACLAASRPMKPRE